MTPFIRYMTRYYARSYQYVAPLLFFFVTIFIVYSSGSSDVLGTYSFGSMWVFLVSTWLAYGYTRVEHGTQQQITVLKMGGIRKYLRAKLCFISLVAVLLACCSVVYPLISHSFAAPVTGGDVLVAFVETISFSLIGVAIGMFFNERFFPKKSSAIMAIVFVSLISIIGEQIGKKLPSFLQWLVWVITPVSHTVYAVGQWTSVDGLNRVLILSWSFVYAFILMTLYAKLSQRKLFD